MPWDLVWKLFLLKKYLQVSWTVHETHHFSAKRWKMKMLCELLNVSFSLFDTKWKCPKNSHWESFLKKKNLIIDSNVASPLHKVVLCKLLNVSFSLFDTKWNHKIFSPREFSKKVVFLTEGLWIIVHYWTSTLF